MIDGDDRVAFCKEICLFIDFDKVPAVFGLDGLVEDVLKGVQAEIRFECVGGNVLG